MFNRGQGRYGGRAFAGKAADPQYGGTRMNDRGQFFNSAGQPSTQAGGATNQMPSFRQLQPVFGGQATSMGQPSAQPAEPAAPTMSGDQQYRAAVAPYQSQKDMAAFGALQNLGVSGLNAMGQYGVARDTALANQSIAAANAFGSMGNAYYNTMGQLGNYAAGLSAAGLNAGAQSANANMGGSFNMDMGGNFNFGGMGGGNGFMASGPEGVVSSGRYGRGGGRGGMGAGFNNSGSGSTSMSLQKGATPQERAGIINQGYGFLGGMAGALNDPNNQAMTLAGLMNDNFGASRAGIMDPSIVNSLNSQVGAGYGALGGLYGMSDYGFNTGRQMQAPQFNMVTPNPTYWQNPAARMR